MTIFMLLTCIDIRNLGDIPVKSNMKEELIFARR